MRYNFAVAGGTVQLVPNVPFSYWDLAGKNGLQSQCVSGGKSCNVTDLGRHGGTVVSTAA